MNFEGNVIEKEKIMQKFASKKEFVFGGVMKVKPLY